MTTSSQTCQGPLCGGCFGSAAPWLPKFSDYTPPIRDEKHLPRGDRAQGLTEMRLERADPDRFHTNRM